MKQFRVVVNGNEYKVAIEELREDATAPAPQPQKAVAAPSPAPQPAANPAPVKTAPQAESNSDASGIVTAAMPGTILDIKVAVGDTVKRGQALLILEAMKMENEIMASIDGVVEEIHVAKGASVNSGDLLMVVA